MCFIIALYHVWPTLCGYLASGLYTQPPGFTTHGSLVRYQVYMCAHVVLTSRAGTYSVSGPAHFPSYVIGIGLAPFGFRGSWECAQTIKSFSSAW